MKQHYKDKRTGISYTLQGDYYLPDFALPDETEQHIGVWGRRHLRHIKQHNRQWRQEENFFLLLISF